MTATSTSVDTLAANQSIGDGKTLNSAEGITELGFFSLGSENSTRRYLGIWYTNVYPLTVVWVANRNTPLESNSGILKLNEKGTLELLNAGNSTIWSSNISSKEVNNPIAYLLDSGNFVVKNGQGTNKDVILWQSFDYLGNTWMPETKIGWNLETGRENYLSSWKSDSDPAEGEYALKLDLRGLPQVIIFKGHEIDKRLGSWNGYSLVGDPNQKFETSPKFVDNEKEVYYYYQVLDSSVFFVYTLTPSGTSQSSSWTTQTRTRNFISAGESDTCENYALCGTNSICIYDGNHPTCECMRGYVPKSPEQWNISIWVNGCVPRNKSTCNNSYTDGFFKYTNLKLPDTSSSWFNITINLDECRKLCLKNCSCTAYANLDIRDGGSGCLLWFNTLVDTRKFSQWGQDLYVRVPASELGAARKFYNKHYKNIRRMEDLDLPTFNLSVIAKATGNFSAENKVGEGGFGPVRKGTLIDGKEIAVKRLSKNSGQGLYEFKNEVALIAKLQHRNLVKLMGCCIEGEEKMLIYDGYIPPEYAARGHFSVKSDVFSYGVVVLEIVSGKKNREFLNSEQDNNLLGHAWRFWTEEKAMELLDEVLTGQCRPSEVIRCIQVGLLCVQQRPKDRPDMSSVVLMLNGDKLLPKPKVPAFYTELDNTTGASPSLTNHKPNSINEFSITMLDAR
ncbi:hypothetical protein Fmac_021221 [Flemingia macrophylla]|uniref:non-specific serine/threonine protein kinase n=1 Tax=Flemingia macrophylla TaxID=520843 RepID=A0ABD1LWA8_9FABA